MDASYRDAKRENCGARAEWERPVLRRLAAREAEGGHSCYNDGNTKAAGNCTQHGNS